MHPLVSNRLVALCGLAGMGLIALLMLSGQLDLIGAAKRAAALLIVLVLVERVLLPLAGALVGETAKPEPVVAEPEPSVTADPPADPATT